MVLFYCVVLCCALGILKKIAFEWTISVLFFSFFNCTASLSSNNRQKRWIELDRTITSDRFPFKIIAGTRITLEKLCGNISYHLQCYSLHLHCPIFSTSFSTSAYFSFSFSPFIYVGVQHPAQMYQQAMSNGPGELHLQLKHLIYVPAFYHLIIDLIRRNIICLRLSTSLFLVSFRIFKKNVFITWVL